MASGMQFTDRAQKALADAVELAQSYAHPQTLPIHLANSLAAPQEEEQGAVGAGQPTPSLFKRVIERVSIYEH